MIKFGTWVHAIEAYGRRRGSGPLIPSLGTRSRCVANFMTPTVLPLKKELLVPAKWETWWFPELVLTLREIAKQKKKSLVRARSRIPDRPAHNN